MTSAGIVDRDRRKRLRQSIESRASGDRTSARLDHCDALAAAQQQRCERQQQKAGAFALLHLGAARAPAHR
jgi:hypothetical protein